VIHSRRARIVCCLLAVAVPCKAREPAGCCQDAPLGNTGECLARLLSGGGMDESFAGIIGVTIKWHYRFTCTTGDPSACSTCYRAEVYYWSNGGWVVAPGGTEAPGSVSGECTSTYTQKLMTSYSWPPPPGPIKSGVLIRVVLLAAAWDPSLPGGCDDQVYEVQGTDTFPIGPGVP
jgi:hypothetical protein